MLIYKVTNRKNGKVYIGQTSVGLDERWYQHVWHSKKDRQAYALQQAIRKYGANEFSCEALCKVANQWANFWETLFIAGYESYPPSLGFGYNLTPGGQGVGTGKDNPNFGKPRSSATKLKISLAQKGKVIPQSQRNRMRLAKLGKPNFTIGLKWVHKTGIRARIDPAKVEFYLTDGWNLGQGERRRLSEASRQKISDAQRGRKLSDEHKKHISQGNMGRVFSESTRQKLREAWTPERLADLKARSQYKTIKEIAKTYAA